MAPSPREVTTSRAAGPPDDGWRAVAARVRDWEPARPVPAAVAVVLAGTVMVCLRRPGAFTHPGLYAEDGAVFLLESLRDGPAALLSPYNGYIHLAPRLVAAVATLLPLGWTPWTYALGSAAVAAGSCSVVLARRSRSLVPSWVGRVLLFTLLLCIPRLHEVHLILNSVLWWCAVALFLCSLVDDPTTRPGRATELAAVPLLVLSGLGGVVLLPLAGLRWWRVRTRHSALVAGVWAAAAVVQLAVYATQDRSNGSVPRELGLVRVAVEKVFGALVLGRSAVDDRWAAGTPHPVFAVLVVVAAVWVAVVVSGLPRTRWAALLWAAGAGVVAGFLALGPAAGSLSDRYTVLPAAAVLVGLVAARPPVRALVAAQVVLVVVVVVLRVGDVVLPPWPDTDWGTARRCLADADRTCVVVLNPPPWTVILPAGVR